MWECPKCSRSFSKINQSHSCTVYPLANHFKGKPYGKELFNDLIKKLKGLKFNIDSVHCCIHLVSNSTFCAVWIGRDKIKIDFRLDNEIKDKRIIKTVKMSANRFLYYLEIKDAKEIDKGLINWIKESYTLTNSKK